MNASTWRELVSGRRRGFAAALLRGLLWMGQLPYWLATDWRNRRYDRGAAVQRVDVPVISVGNLTVGGTGKTPLVEWLARWFCAHDIRVTLISRGYGAKAGAANDEALELAQKLPDVPHLQNPDRVAAARTAIQQQRSQLILLDDAFQHRRIARDLDIVLLDALHPFGFGHLLPRGALRESLTGLARADIVALSRSDMVDAARREAIRNKVRQYAPRAIWLEMAHRPRRLLSAAGETTPLDTLAGRSVAGFAGIGNPAGFQHTLAECGYRVQAFRELPDHHVYDRRSIETLARWTDSLDGIEAAITTHKDLVKINAERLGRHSLWALTVELEILAGHEELEAKLRPLAKRALQSPRTHGG